MFKPYIYISTIALIIISSCKTSPEKEIIELKTVIEKEYSNREYSKQSVLWVQMSAEYRALCYQAFNLAKYRLDVAVSTNKSKKSLAIITDLDETIIDNSAYNAHLIKEDKNYTRESWAEWVKMEKTKIVPGALDFIKYAESIGVDIFYISNRKVDRQEETLSNLKALGINVKDEDHILLKVKSSAKETRRNKVYENHEVVLYMGDNLSDFAEVFDKKSTDERNSLVNDMQTEFGTKFIVFPNPMYGDWETKGLFEGKYDWTVEERDSIMGEKLRGY